MSVHPLPFTISFFLTSAISHAWIHWSHSFRPLSSSISKGNYWSPPELLPPSSFSSKMCYKKGKLLTAPLCCFGSASTFIATGEGSWSLGLIFSGSFQVRPAMWSPAMLPCFFQCEPQLSNQLELDRNSPGFTLSF